MSFLFKIVLGERVVHPPAEQSDTNGSSGASASEPASMAAAASPSPPVQPLLATRHAKKDLPRPGGDADEDRYKVVARDFASLARQREEPAERTFAPANANGKGGERIDTRTLLLRVQTCSIAQDMRDAFRALVDGAEDLPYVLAAREVLHLVEPLRTHADDAEVVGAALQVLADLTDIRTYPSSDGVGGKPASSYTVPERERRQIRNSFAHELLPEVPLFVEHIRRSRSSGEGGALVAGRTCLNCVRLIMHLEEYKPGEVHKLLLDCRAIGTVVDLLSDRTQDARLRHETLALIAALTATDSDMQTLFAFENGFDAIFHVVEAEGGIDGGVLVSECLSTVHNTLRGNHSTQKLFLEMGGAARLRSVLAEVPDRLARAAAARKGGSPGVEPSLAPLTNMQSIIVLSAVSIVSCLLREADAAGGAAESGQGGARGTATGGATVATATRQRLIGCGLLRPLAGLALSGAAVDDAARIESMRALGALLSNCPDAVREFLARDKAYAVTTLVRAEAPQAVASWSLTRATLEYLFSSSDRTLLGATARVVGCVLATAPRSPDGVAAVTRELCSGFAPVPGVSGFDAVSHTTVRESGAALALALTGATANSYGKLYAARVFAALLRVPGIAAELAAAPWGASPREGAMTPRGLPTVSAVSLSPALPATFLNAFVAYYVYCVSGGHASQRMDTAALGAYTLALLLWLSESPPCGAALLREPRWFAKLLDIAGGQGNVHVRLWCACIAARLCCMATPESVGPTGRRTLLELFVNTLGGAAVLDSLVFDVGASTPQWSSPAITDVFSPAAATGSNIYDATLVKTLTGVMAEFKRVCPSPGGCAGGAGAESRAAAPSEQWEGPPTAVQAPSAVHKAQLHAVADAKAVKLQAENDALRARVAELEAALKVTQAANAAATSPSPPSPPRPEDSEELLRLRESVRALEDALLSKEDEHRQLVSTMNMMEAHLQQREAQDSARRVAAAAVAEAAPLPIPPPPRATADVGIQTEEMALVRTSDAVTTTAAAEVAVSAAAEEELRRQLDATAADRDDLLVMVAELNEECVSARAASMLPSPAHAGSVGNVPLLPQHWREAAPATGDQAHMEGPGRELFPFPTNASSTADAQPMDGAAAEPDAPPHPTPLSWWATGDDSEPPGHLADTAVPPHHSTTPAPPCTEAEMREAEEVGAYAEPVGASTAEGDDLWGAAAGLVEGADHSVLSNPFSNSYGAHPLRELAGAADTPRAEVQQPTWAATFAGGLFDGDDEGAGGGGGARVPAGVGLALDAEASPSLEEVAAEVRGTNGHAPAEVPIYTTHVVGGFHGSSHRSPPLHAATHIPRGAVESHLVPSSSDAVRSSNPFAPRDPPVKPRTFSDAPVGGGADGHVAAARESGNPFAGSDGGGRDDFGANGDADDVFFETGSRHAGEAGGSTMWDGEDTADLR